MDAQFCFLTDEKFERNNKKKKREERDTLINKKNSATFDRELHFSFLRIQQQQQDVYNIRIAAKEKERNLHLALHITADLPLLRVIFTL